MIKKCEYGHYYDDKIYKTCPYCNSEKNPKTFKPEENFVPCVYGGPPIEIEKKKHGFRSLRKCKNGHIYFGTKDTVCPKCSKNRASQKEFSPQDNYNPIVYGGPPIDYKFDPSKNRFKNTNDISEKMLKTYSVYCTKCNQITEIQAVNEPNVCCKCGNTEISVKEK
ncbi:MAG: hypothetical protein IJB44_05115 [Clostridia bacterium]|nr:hypothetical protein [Clostridia bacterium]MBQ4628438.1 hypothetical protein [Clostridia bacterium]